MRIGLDPSGLYRGVFVKTLEEGGTAEGIEEGDVIGRIPWYVLWIDWILQYRLCGYDAQYYIGAVNLTLLLITYHQGSHC